MTMVEAPGSLIDWRVIQHRTHFVLVGALMWTSPVPFGAGVEGDARHVVATGLEPDLVVLVAGRGVEMADGHDDGLDGAVGASRRRRSRRRCRRR